MLTVKILVNELPFFLVFSLYLLLPSGHPKSCCIKMSNCNWDSNVYSNMFFHLSRNQINFWPGRAVHYHRCLWLILFFNLSGPTHPSWGVTMMWLWLSSYYLVCLFLFSPHFLVYEVCVSKTKSYKHQILKSWLSTEQVHNTECAVLYPERHNLQADICSLYLLMFPILMRH